MYLVLPRSAGASRLVCKGIVAKLDPHAERELLELLEEALAQPVANRREWLKVKLKERNRIDRKLEDLIALAERNDIPLWRR